MKKSFMLLFFLIGSFLYGQNCIANAGENMEVCGGKKVGSKSHVKQRSMMLFANDVM